MFYRVDEKGQPIDWAVAPYHEDCLYTPHQVRYGFDGIPYIDKGSAPELSTFMLWYLAIAWWVFVLGTITQLVFKALEG